MHRTIPHLVFLLGVAWAGAASAEPAPGDGASPPGCRARPAVDARAVTASAAERLRLAPGTTRGARAGEYLLRDGRVLVQGDAGEAGDLFTADAYRLYRAHLEEDLKLRHVAYGDAFHPLRGFIDDGDGFIVRAPALVGELRHRLDLDGDGASEADAITRFASRWREARCRPDPTIFRELTAAAGDLLVRRGGRWVARSVDGVVEPVVELSVGGARRSVEPWAWVTELLAGRADLDALLADALAPPLTPAAASSATAAAAGSSTAVVALFGAATPTGTVTVEGPAVPPHASASPTPGAAPHPALAPAVPTPRPRAGDDAVAVKSEAGAGTPRREASDGATRRATPR